MVSCTQKYSTSQYIPIQTMIHNVYLSIYFHIYYYIISMGVFEVFATRNSLVGNCYLESETCRKHREGPQVWYPAHRNTAHLSTYPYKL